MWDKKESYDNRVKSLLPYKVHCKKCGHVLYPIKRPQICRYCGTIAYPIKQQREEFKNKLESILKGE